MSAVIRAREFLSFSLCSSSFSHVLQPWKLEFSGLKCASFSSVIDSGRKGLLDLQEIEKVLSDVRANDVKVIPVPKHCDWADYMVLATGRSTWHVKNIAQALIYKNRFQGDGYICKSILGILKTGNKCNSTLIACTKKLCKG